MIKPGDSPTHEKGQSGLFQAALSCLCPRCAQPTLFEAPARVALKCENCQLDFTGLERGGRLAGLVTVLIAAILIGLATAIDVAISPPFWLQVMFWAPATVAAVIGVLRFYKTALLYRQYEAQTGKSAFGE
ncbi:DUF983 domain-containing protein [Erythrobacter rubeus]|uniref:DUF983 domain-containing protein n=1 Tax=Erythrobacter rubeus TaxID=2760803 RepID=A0ABR8KSH6_9SPHN|nr:DUF983 domain-containing protein [Erythrobacter rubeus]MBD2842300.1 DUF983 domain-containing protein [Erythrobacter rubeus]